MPEFFIRGVHVWQTLSKLKDDMSGPRQKSAKNFHKNGGTRLANAVEVEGARKKSMKNVLDQPRFAQLRAFFCAHNRVPRKKVYKRKK